MGVSCGGAAVMVPGEPGLEVTGGNPDTGGAPIPLGKAPLHSGMR